MNNFICKRASLEDRDTKWAYELARCGNDKETCAVRWKQNRERYERGYIIPYYGILDGNMICEATAMVHPAVVQNSPGLVNSRTVYLSAFRTAERFQGKGYFSKLFYFMVEDLRRRGFTKATLGVEVSDEKNKGIYRHYGFDEYIKSGQERYADGTVIDVDYFGKKLNRIKWENDKIGDLSDSVPAVSGRATGYIQNK